MGLMPRSRLVFPRRVRVFYVVPATTAGSSTMTPAEICSERLVRSINHIGLLKGSHLSSQTGRGWPCQGDCRSGTLLPGRASGPE